MDLSTSGINNDSLVQPSKFNKFKFPIFLLLLLLLGLGGYYLFAGNLPKNFRMGITKEVKPKLIKETKVESVTNEFHPDLFVAELEFDPKSNLVKQIVTAKINGDSPNLLTSPSNSLEDFSYLTEVISPSKGIVLNGWSSQAKERITQSNGKFKIYVVVKYEKDARINLYLPGNKLVWTTKI